MPELPLHPSLPPSIKMFSKFCVLAAILPLISALTLNAPKEAVTSSGSITLTWTSDSSDQSVFSLELANEGFHDTFAIANNVPTSAGNITLTLPSVPVNVQYTIQAVNISNVKDVLSTTPSFNIGPPVSSSESSTATSKSSGSSGNSSGAAAPTRSVVTPVGGTSSSFGVTVSNTSPAATGSNTSSGTSTGASGPSSTNFNSGLPVRLNVNKGFMASAMLSLVAGAAVVAL